MKILLIFALFFILACGGDKTKDLCEPNPCKNSGICVKDNDTITCDCSNTDFTGDLCEKKKEDLCKTENCSNNGKCSNNDGQALCTCNDGYKGDKCEINIDDCKNQNCSDHGSCQDGVNSYTCSCNTGFSGNDCENCANGYHKDGENCVIDENCTTNSCGKNGNCDDSTGTVKCTCNAGYEGGRCEDCTNGYHKDGENCVIDEKCEENTCSKHGECSITNGVVQCSCNTGYEGNSCETNIDDCINKDCSGHGTCIDGVNSYTCNCTDGYTGNNCEIAPQPESCFDAIEELTIGEKKTFQSTSSLEDKFHPQKTESCKVFSSNGKEKVYKIDLEAGKKIKVTASNNDLSDDISVYIMDSCNSNYQCLKGVDQYGEQDEWENTETFEYIVPETKTYFVVVDTNGTAIFSGGSLKVEYLADPSPCPNQIQAYDGSCVSLSTCDNVNNITKLTIGHSSTNEEGTQDLGNNYELPHDSCNTEQTNGEDKIYRINLEAGKKIKVTVEQLYSTGGEPGVYILNTCKTDAYKCIAGNDTNTENIETLEYTVPKTGEYFIVVDSFTDSSPLVEYSIKVEYIN